MTLCFLTLCALVGSEKVFNELYIVCLKNYSRQSADDHEYSVETDRVLDQRSVQNNTTALLALRCVLYHTILKALTCKSHLFYPECILFCFNRNKYNNFDVACL